MKFPGFPGSCRWHSRACCAFPTCASCGRIFAALRCRGPRAVCYLYPGGMRDVAHKLATEMPLPLTLVSNTFALPSMQPQETIRLDDLYRTVIRVYRWRGFRAAEPLLRP